MKFRNYSTLAVALVVHLFLSGTATAFPIAASGAGLKVIVGGTGDVIATYQGNSAAYSNDLYLVQPGSSDIFIFNNHSSAVGSTVNLGAFAIGTELLFRLHVNNTGYDFYTGVASLNPDNHVHARVQENWLTDTTLVSFEDLYNGPFVYNDLSFSFTNTVTTPPPPTGGIPEPSTILLISLGLAGFGFRWKKQA